MMKKKFEVIDSHQAGQKGKIRKLFDLKMHRLTIGKGIGAGFNGEDHEETKSHSFSNSSKVGSTSEIAYGPDAMFGSDNSTTNAVRMGSVRGSQMSRGSGSFRSKLTSHFKDKIRKESMVKRIETIVESVEDTDM